MTKNKIAIIGTLGIPAKYGGFETLTEHLTQQLGEKMQFTVYCSSDAYSIRIKEYNNAKLEYIPLKGNSIQSIPYDIVSLFKAAKTNDTILILGVSGCIALPLFRLFYKHKWLIVNIDGLEHRRAKWNSLTRRFLKFSERLAVKFANVIISDNESIRKYLLEEYNKESALIAYGGDHAKNLVLTDNVKNNYNIPSEYSFKVCRIEPENNIHVILEAFTSSYIPLVIIGNWENSKYGQDLKRVYGNNPNILMLDPIYNQDRLNQIRSNCTIYLHGHSAGGTNPSLVEAMNLGLPIFAFDCSYNRETTLNNAKYFTNAADLKELVRLTSKESLNSLGLKMQNIAKEKYTWEKISFQYEEIFTMFC
jgi:glycosyltransferase involved in cell wall biosynthesis